MNESDDYPKIGRDFEKWSDIDSWIPTVDLDEELFIRHNTVLASLVILSALFKTTGEERNTLLQEVRPGCFSPKSFPRYLFERLVVYLKENEKIPEEELEKWITDYSLEVWGESPPNGRSFYGDHYTIRQILSFTPKKSQTKKAIELRQMVMKREGYQ